MWFYNFSMRNWFTNILLCFNKAYEHYSFIFMQHFIFTKKIQVSLQT